MISGPLFVIFILFFEGLKQEFNDFQWQALNHKGNPAKNSGISSSLRLYFPTV